MNRIWGWFAQNKVLAFEPSILMSLHWPPSLHPFIPCVWYQSNTRLHESKKERKNLHRNRCRSLHPIRKLTHTQASKSVAATDFRTHVPIAPEKNTVVYKLFFWLLYRFNKTATFSSRSGSKPGLVFRCALLAVTKNCSEISLTFRRCLLNCPSINKGHERKSRGLGVFKKKKKRRRAVSASDDIDEIQSWFFSALLSKFSY